uniref:Uncharacterized protein n=1 Tax=Rhizophora mucronata TaxID=61149 RepID=A0A2P2PH27_RHIMU
MTICIARTEKEGKKNSKPFKFERERESFLMLRLVDKKMNRKLETFQRRKNLTSPPST